MMKKMHFLLLPMVAFLFSSCEDVIDIKLPQGKELMVVEAWLSNKPEAQYVKLYKSVPYLSEPVYPAVRQASIILSDDAGNSEALTEVEPGKYEVKQMSFTVNRTYHLSIHAAEGSYEASTKMHRLGLALDSVVYKYEKKSLTVSKEGYYPYLYGQELPGLGDYFLLKIRQNGKELKSVSDLYIISDQYVDGNYVSAVGLNMKEPFKEGDKIKYELYSLTEDYYRFWDDVKRQLNNGGLFAVPSTNTRTNLVKKDAQSMNVVGYFGVSATMTLENTVK
ncbi:MAG TPA: DUF4249 domain-containing protein [Daejeonella sp.]|nr:DUF4249 domain-containing protein [Daejeonella sp.]